MSATSLKWFVRGVLVLPLVLGASSCGHESGEVHPGTSKKTKPIPCDQSVDVDAKQGVVQQAVFLCEDDKLTWNANGHQFVVEFKGETPFTNGEKKFHNGHPNGTANHQYSQLTVYKYTITVDSNSPVDPQVVAGGNP